MLGTTPDFHLGGRGSIPRLGRTLFYYFFQKTGNFNPPFWALPTEKFEKYFNTVMSLHQLLV